MPQINEYGSQVDAQGAVGGITPNLEAVSLFGRGIEHMGAALDQAGDMFHRREAQQEQSEIFGQMAQARALWSTKLKERLKDGSLNTDQFDQEYADYINKIGADVKTAEGKDFFNKSANRLGGTLMQNAITGQAQIAGQKAFDSVKNGVSLDSSTLMSQPDQFHDVHDNTLQFIAGQQATGAINEVQASRLREELMPELAKGALRGWMTKDPGQGNENVAKQMLDKGAFDQYLNSDQKKQMYAEAREQDHIRNTGDLLAKDNAHKNLEFQGQDFLDKNANRINNGDFDPRELNNAPLTFQQKDYALSKIKARIKGEVATDPRVYNDTYGKLITGDITDRSQIQDVFKQGGLSPDDADKLIRRIDATPDGVQLKQSMKNIDKQIQGLNFKMGGVQTDAGAKASYAARQEMDAQADLFVTSGKGSMRDFYMNQPTSAPTHPLNILNHFRMSAIDQLRMGAQEQIDRVNGTQANPTIKYTTSPTKEIPPSSPMVQPQQGTDQEPSAPAAPADKSRPGDAQLGPWQIPGTVSKDKIPTSPSSILDPHPNDTPEVAANRQKNKADLESVKDMLYNIKTSVSGMAEAQGLTKSLDDVSKQLGSAAIKPSSNPRESLKRPGESQSDYLKRMGL